ncbi:MAG TPA: Ig-like domain-containing protein [Mobilitalea sp.]|nr:Ig-like domain-containing protein [Mobilitalea sp.]
MKSFDNRKCFIFDLYKIIIVVIAVILIFHFLNENSSIFYRKSFTMPFSLHLNEQDLYLIKGEEFKLSVFAINKRVSFYSTNFRVAGVNFNGRVFGYQTGKAFIIAKVDNKELRCRVHVIDINKSVIVIKKGQTFRLKIKGTNAFVVWKSKNQSVATVNIFGSVKAVSRGSTVIIAKVKGRTLKCTVKVR